MTTKMNSSSKCSWKQTAVVATMFAATLLAGLDDASASKIRVVDANEAVATTGITVSGQALLAPGGYLAGVVGELSVGRFAVTGSLSRMGYEYEEEGYYEAGGATLVNVRGRFYPMDDGRQIWLAGGIAVGAFTTDWVVYGDSYGTVSGMGIAPNVGVGYKILLLDNKLALDPQLLFGVVAGTDSENPFFGGAGVSVGYKF